LHNAKQARIGHFVEAQILEAIEVDYIDESEVLTMADEDNHINKTKFKVPFVCGCRNLGEALVSTALKAIVFGTIYSASFVQRCAMLAVQLY
jgi:pyridoxal 5'-phosphate synthase pdxS subunit